jgi:hypothetical protein
MSEIRCIHCGERVEGVTCIEEDNKLIVFAHRTCHERVIGARTCPDCHSALQPPTFLNIRPEGYVCESCMMYYDADLTPIAKIL